MSSSPGKLKAEIVRRLQAGERGAEIARALGTSRQYVSILGKRLAESSPEEVLASRRGRPRDQPFTPEEARSLRERLGGADQETSPDAPADHTPAAIKAWFRATHGRTLTVHQLRRFCTEEGLRLASPAQDAEADEAEEPGAYLEPPPRGHPRQMTAADIAAMARSNAEVAERMAARRAAPPPPARRAAPKISRNAVCPCGSGRKFKQCCGA